MLSILGDRNMLFGRFLRRVVSSIKLSVPGDARAVASRSAHANVDEPATAVADFWSAVACEYPDVGPFDCTLGQVLT